jgi:hypothetical protein
MAGSWAGSLRKTGLVDSLGAKGWDKSSEKNTLDLPTVRFWLELESQADFNSARIEHAGDILVPDAEAVLVVAL